MKASQWIDRVKVKKQIPSDYAVAKSLGLTQSAVSKLRATETTLSEDSSIAVALALEINPAIVLADQAMERTKNDQARGAWSSILERLGGVAAMALITVASIGMAPTPSQAAETSVYYV